MHTPTIFQLLALLLSVRCVASNTCISIASKEKLETQPKRPEKPRWAIVALVNKNSDMSLRNNKLVKVLKPHAHKHNITVLMFSEHVLDPAKARSWEKSFDGIASVKLVDTSKNGFDPPAERYGYKYMCKFFAIDIYDYLKDEYDYYLRCDNDCFLEKLNYDIMEYVERNDVQYGFAVRKLEAHGPTKKTLPLWVSKYNSRCDISPTAPMDQSFETCFNFYNNFHIGSVWFFTRPDVHHFLLAVNSSGFVLSHRWGDSTIQAYAVRNFMNPSKIRQLPELVYIHGSHHAVVSTFGDGSESAVPQRLPMWRTPE